MYCMFSNKVARGSFGLVGSKFSAFWELKFWPPCSVQYCIFSLRALDLLFSHFLPSLRNLMASASASCQASISRRARSLWSDPVVSCPVRLTWVRMIAIRLSDHTGSISCNAMWCAQVRLREREFQRDCGAARDSREHHQRVRTAAEAGAQALPRQSAPTAAQAFLARYILLVRTRNSASPSAYPTGAIAIRSELRSNINKIQHGCGWLWLVGQIWLF